jgi:hypothetical protein
MAARRLLIIMVVLLTISTLAAALVPPPQERGETTTSTSTSTAMKERATEAPKASDLVRAEIPVPKGGEAPREVRVKAGDQLALVVTSRQPGEVSVPDFGLIEFAGPGNDASFDILIEEAGEFPVRFQGSGEVAMIIAEGARKRPGQS